MFNEGKSFSTLSVIDINARFPGQVDVKTSPFKFVIPIDNMLGQNHSLWKSYPKLRQIYPHIYTLVPEAIAFHQNLIMTLGIAENRSLRANFEDDKLWYPYQSGWFQEN